MIEMPLRHKETKVHKELIFNDLTFVQTFMAKKMLFKVNKHFNFSTFQLSIQNCQ